MSLKTAREFILSFPSNAAAARALGLGRNSAPISLFLKRGYVTKKLRRQLRAKGLIDPPELARLAARVDRETLKRFHREREAAGVDTIGEFVELLLDNWTGADGADAQKLDQHLNICADGLPAGHIEGDYK